VKPKQLPSFCALPAAYERCAADDKFEAAVACKDMKVLQCRTDEIDTDQALDGFPEAYAAAMGDDKFETTLVKLPAAYATMAADDKLEAVLGHADAEELRERSAVAAILDDQYEATLAKADMNAPQSHADAFSPKMTMIDDLPKAYAATVVDDKLEVRLAFADRMDVQARADAADMESPAWDLGLSESSAAAAAFNNLEAVNNMRELQRCIGTEEEQTWAAALPEAYSATVEDDNFEAVLACADRRDLQCRNDAAEDILEQQLWAAAFRKGVEDAAEKDNNKHEAVFAGADKRECQKRMHLSSPLPESLNLTNSCKEGALDGNQSVKRQKTIDEWARQESECSTTVPADGSESPSMTF